MLVVKCFREVLPSVVNALFVESTGSGRRRSRGTTSVPSSAGGSSGCCSGCRSLVGWLVGWLILKSLPQRQGKQGGLPDHALGRTAGVHMH